MIPKITCACIQHGSTAVMCAAEHGHFDCVEVLVQAGADLDIEDKVWKDCTLSQLKSFTCICFTVGWLYCTHLGCLL